MCRFFRSCFAHTHTAAVVIPVPASISIAGINIQRNFNLRTTSTLPTSVATWTASVRAGSYGFAIIGGTQLSIQPTGSPNSNTLQVNATGLVRFILLILMLVLIFTRAQV